jgi:hypothetical protein
MISLCRSKYNESVKVASEVTNDAHSRSTNAEGKAIKHVAKIK